jgi:hypothetical protein
LAETAEATKGGVVSEKRHWPPVHQYRFRAGPYVPPAVNVGVKLKDEMLGEVTVDGFTKAPISWPGTEFNRGRHEGLLPILTGALVRAVCEEDELTVAHYWGVTRYMVNEWKQAIAGVKDSNQVIIAIAMKKQDPAFRERFGFE